MTHVHGWFHVFTVDEIRVGHPDFADQTARVGDFGRVSQGQSRITPNLAQKDTHCDGLKKSELEKKCPKSQAFQCSIFFRIINMMHSGEKRL